MPETRPQASASSSLRRRAELLLASALALGVAAFVAVGAAYVLPPVVSNLTAQVADGATVTTIAPGFGVIAPEGWLVQPGTPLVVRSPDGVLAATFEVGLETTCGVIGDGPLRTETLASGEIVQHCDRGTDAVDARVGGAEQTSVRVLARVAAGAERDDYRLALAQLLEGVRR